MTSNGAYAVVCVVSNVSRADAYELSYRMSGPTLSAATGASASANAIGQVNYNFTGNAGDVFIYVTHR